MADELLKHDFITMIDKKNMNRKLIILNYLSRCGYKVLYNKKKNYLDFQYICGHFYLYFVSETLFGLFVHLKVELKDKL